MWSGWQKICIANGTRSSSIYKNSIKNFFLQIFISPLVWFLSNYSALREILKIYLRIVYNENVLIHNYIFEFINGFLYFIANIIYIHLILSVNQYVIRRYFIVSTILKSHLLYNYLCRWNNYHLNSVTHSASTCERQQILFLLYWAISCRHWASIWCYLLPPHHCLQHHSNLCLTLEWQCRSHMISSFHYLLL